MGISRSNILPNKDINKKVSVISIYLNDFFQAISKLKDGSLSAAELCEKCITRAKRAQELNFIVTDNFSQSQREAVHSARLWSEYGN